MVNSRGFGEVGKCVQEGLTDEKHDGWGEPMMMDMKIAGKNVS
jgi:hypothetical protein